MDRKEMVFVLGCTAILVVLIMVPIVLAVVYNFWWLLLYVPISACVAVVTELSHY
jgi:hypothetical protein